MPQLELDIHPQGRQRQTLMPSAKLSTPFVFLLEAQNSHICPACLSEQNPFLNNTQLRPCPPFPSHQGIGVETALPVTTARPLPSCQSEYRALIPSWCRPDRVQGQLRPPGVPQKHGAEASGFQDQHLPSGKPYAWTPGSQRGGWARPPACRHTCGCPAACELR